MNDCKPSSFGLSTNLYTRLIEMTLRSLLGDRDSEFGIYIKDVEFDEGIDSHFFWLYSPTHLVKM